MKGESQSFARGPRVPLIEREDPEESDMEDWSVTRREPWTARETPLRATVDPVAVVTLLKTKYEVAVDREGSVKEEEEAKDTQTPSEQVKPAMAPLEGQVPAVVEVQDKFVEAKDEREVEA